MGTLCILMPHRTFANIYEDKLQLMKSFIRGNHVKNTTKPSSDTTAYEENDLKVWVMFSPIASQQLEMCCLPSQKHYNCIL